MPVQLAGTSANAEVETGSKALRITPKPIDYGALGIFSIAGVSGAMAAALGANSPIFSFRWTTTNIAVLKKLVISAGNTATAFAAGVITFNAFVARSFSASDTGGTAATLTGNNQKLRTSMATTTVGDIRWSSTATLTAGTRTKDANPFASLSTSIPAVAGTPLIIPSELFAPRPGEYPLVLAQNEGFVVEATVPATGTWTFSLTAQWEELAAYVP
jgi:hypothetical protein